MPRHDPGAAVGVRGESHGALVGEVVHLIG